MNGARQERSALQSGARWFKIRGATSCCFGLRSVPKSERPSAAAADRYKQAIRRQKQRQASGLFQVSAYPRMDVRRYCFESPQGLGVVATHCRNQKRDAPESRNLVRTHLDVIGLGSRDGSPLQSVPAWSIPYEMTVPKIARLTPYHGVEGGLIAPLDGVMTSPATPSSGAIRGIFTILLHRLAVCI